MRANLGKNLKGPRFYITRTFPILLSLNLFYWTLCYCSLICQWASGILCAESGVFLFTTV